MSDHKYVFIHIIMFMTCSLMAFSLFIILEYKQQNILMEHKEQ